MKVVVDTNVILHGKWLEDLPWKDILNKVPNEVLIPHKVLQELDEKKLDPKHRDRAKKRLRNLNDLIRKKINSKINISYKVLKTSFLSEEFKPGLNPDLADDCILNGILKYEEERGQKIILLTFDLSCSLRASEYSIKEKILDSQYELKVNSSKEKEIKKLKSKLEILENRIPKLKICFEDKETKKTITFSYRRTLDSYEKISKHKNNLLNKCPPLAHPDSHSNKSKSTIKLGELSKTLEGIAKQLTPPKKEYERYNKERKVYIEKIDSHIKDIQKYDEIHSRAFEFELLINNTGACPASSVGADLYFPDGFKLIDLDRNKVDEIEHPPEPPDPPEKPATPLMSVAHNKSFNHFPTLSIPPEHYKVNNTRPSIEKINSYRVKFPTINEIMHHDYFSLGRFKIFFNPHKDIKSFQVNYKIHCREFLKPKEQKLHFIIKDGK